MDISDTDLAWLAGLLEGEGCFCYQCSPGIKLGMTDKDVVSKVANLLGRWVRGPYRYRTNKKAVFYTEIWSHEAIWWMKKLLPYMSVRRSAKIKEIVERWELAPDKGHKLDTGAVSNCHPDRKHYANGFCRACYKRDRRSKGLVG